VTDEESVNRPLATDAPKLLVDTARGFNPATAFLDADGVSAVLSFLNKDTDTEVVATPRAVTMDNQTATLSVTRAFPIFQITPGSANSPAGATITYTNLGTILYVTPRIAADKNISLKVTPEVSNIDSVDRQIVNGQANTANIYAIRRIDTSVMIPSGHTLVMGGLINDSKTKANTKVPILGDLPLAGAAFRSESKRRSKSNLILFITPTVLDEGDFHQSGSGKEYMQTRYQESAEPKETAWDSAEPHDWTKPVR
jgi:general secretion pathway protein D